MAPTNPHFVELLLPWPRSGRDLSLLFACLVVRPVSRCHDAIYVCCFTVWKRRQLLSKSSDPYPLWFMWDGITCLLAFAFSSFERHLYPCFPSLSATSMTSLTMWRGPHQGEVWVYGDEESPCLGRTPRALQIFLSRVKLDRLRLIRYSCSP